METPHQAAGILVLALHALIIIALAIRVIMRRLPTGASLAWLILIVVLPLAGAVAYLILGERHLGRRRAKRAVRLFDQGRPAAGGVRGKRRGSRGSALARRRHLPPGRGGGGCAAPLRQPPRTAGKCG